MNKEPLKVGITGSIGTGKTTVANEFNKYGYPVWNSDSIVHDLYQSGKEGYEIIKNILPQATNDEKVDRSILSENIINNDKLLKKIQQCIYPLLEKKRREFINSHKKHKLLIFEIPLLFETSCENWLDFVVIVTAPYEVQKKRVMSRKLMTYEKFVFLLSKQLDTNEMKKKANFIINTDTEFLALSKNVKEVLKTVLNNYD